MVNRRPGIDLLASRPVDPTYNMQKGLSCLVKENILQVEYRTSYTLLMEGDVKEAN